MASRTLSDGLYKLCFPTTDLAISFVRLNILGYRVGIRAFEMMSWRAEAASKAPKREIRFLPALMVIHTQLWKAIFGKQADGIEKSVEKEDECEQLKFLINLFFDDGS